MNLASGAFDRQVATGRLSRINPVDAAMMAESFRVLPAASQDRHAIVQLYGRKDPIAPLGLGSFTIDEKLARALSARLLEVADDSAATNNKSDGFVAQ